MSDKPPQERKHRNGCVDGMHACHCWCHDWPKEWDNTEPPQDAMAAYNAAERSSDEAALLRPRNDTVAALAEALWDEQDRCWVCYTIRPHHRQGRHACPVPRILAALLKG